jgi:hypothetical protein
MRFQKALVSNWDHYWKDYQPGRDGHRSFYKSTLIVPLTLWNNEVSQEFTNAVNISDIERSVFGFLCFDHRDLDYFDESSDVFVGKIFADVLCTYVFIRMIYTDFSKTFEKIRGYLGKNVPLKGHEISQVRPSRSVSSLWDQYLVPPPALPDKPNLITTDKVLLKFARADRGKGVKA